ncbi:transaldolase [Mycolicibacterium sp.]|uniref:transaldolase n=1 Tax=Mycolicibacterium sp. TaxID=2320850 RepID=UPI001A19695A|nr:transaldolase [Mycolicibacterium sp.]MBJ7339115.1 transaldolase [Mycolicibacterium sp.]
MTKLTIDIYADGANVDEMLDALKKPYIKGFTTNPTLMHKAGLTDYRAFAVNVLTHIRELPISFEVFSDDFDEMERQARLIDSWGPNVYVKIPVTNTHGEFAGKVIASLASDGIKLNVTALLTVDQVRQVAATLDPATPAIVSVFAGRIADTGIDPLPIMKAALKILEDLPNAKLLWASPRELLNLVQADQMGCHVVTVTPDILKKLPLLDKDLTQFSLETVQMFHDDAQKAGFSLPTGVVAKL